jgi:hypothetical protein
MRERRSAEVMKGDDGEDPTEYSVQRYTMDGWSSLESYSTCSNSNEDASIPAFWALSSSHPPHPHASPAICGLPTSPIAPSEPGPQNKSSEYSRGIARGGGGDSGNNCLAAGEMPLDCLEAARGVQTHTHPNDLVPCVMHVQYHQQHLCQMQAQAHLSTYTCAPDQ